MLNLSKQQQILLFVKTAMHPYQGLLCKHHDKPGRNGLPLNTLIMYAYLIRQPKRADITYRHFFNVQPDMCISSEAINNILYVSGPCCFTGSTVSPPPPPPKPWKKDAKEKIQRSPKTKIHAWLTKVLEY